MTLKKYALIVGEDVFGTIRFDDDPTKNINGPRLSAGFSSDPKVIEVDANSEIEFGWTWDGTNFIKPGE
jgi:hypothetical protein